MKEIADKITERNTVITGQSAMIKSLEKMTRKQLDPEGK
jgi:hypothetical protein